MGFVTNPAWIGAIGTVLAIVVPLFIYRRQKQTKSISYEILSENPLVSVRSEVKGRIQVLLDGEQLENLYLVLVRFMNDGNVPVVVNDYERPINHCC